MGTTTMRISRETLARFRRLAESTGTSLQEAVARAAGMYERELYIAELNAGYAELRRDPDGWAEELAERELWDRTLTDGLEANE